MDVVEIRSEIDALPERVWALLGDFGGVASWNPYVASADVSGDGVGMTRVIHASGGGIVTEVLELHEPKQWRLRYSVELESGARSTADVAVEASARGAVVVWKSLRENVLPDEQKAVIRATLQSRIDALADALKGQ